MGLINEHVKNYMRIKNYYGLLGIIKLSIRQIKTHLFLRLSRILPHSSLRIACLRIVGVNIGKNVFIGLNIWIDPLFPEYIYINDYAEIGDNAFIYAHSRGSIPLLEIYPLMVKKVVIGKGVWVGAPNVTILPGVKIGDYSIIAAGAVVNKNVPSGVLVGGVPIKIIKHLNINTLKDS